MQPPVTSAQMRSLEKLASEKFGISTAQLMENAGRGCAEFISRRHKGSQIAVVFCGKGNNGGDGFVTARYLRQLGWNVTVYLLAAPSELNGDALLNCARALKLNIPFIQCRQPEDFPRHSSVMDSAQVIVDALLGTGISRPLTEPYTTVVTAINRAVKPSYAIDIPSGLNADTGAVCGVCVQASVTLTLGMPKIGLSMGSGPVQSGQVHVLDIGLPKAAPMGNA